MGDERRCLVQLSLHHDAELLLRRLAAAEGVEPATLAHEAMMWGLRRLQEGDGGGDALPTRDGVGPGLVGGRAYPLRRVVDVRHEPIDIGQDYMLDKATELLSCGHTGHTFIVVYPAQVFDGQMRRCAHCASPEQRARAGQRARSRSRL